MEHSSQESMDCNLQQINMQKNRTAWLPKNYKQKHHMPIEIVYADKLQTGQT